MTWIEIAGLIAESGLAHVATSSSGGGPHVAQVAVVPEGDVLWMMTMRTTGKAANLADHPQVALMWTGGGAETYVWGDVDEIDDPVERSRVFSSGWFPYDPAGFFERADHPDLLVLRIRPTRATVVGGAAGPRRHRWSA